MPNLKIVDFEPLDLYNSLWGNQDENEELHKKGLICPGALLISKLEALVPETQQILQYHAKMIKPLQIPHYGKEIAYEEHPEEGKWLIKDLAARIAVISLNPYNSLPTQVDYTHAKKIRFDASIANLDHYCMSIGLRKDDLLRKYQFLMPPTFGAYLFVLPAQIAAKQDTEIQKAIADAEKKFTGKRKIMLYREQTMFADMENAIHIPLAHEEWSQDLEFIVTRKEIKKIGPALSIKQACALMNNKKPYLSGETTGAIIFE